MKLFKKIGLIAIVVLAFSAIFVLSSVTAFAADEIDMVIEETDKVYDETYPTENETDCAGENYPETDCEGENYPETEWTEESYDTEKGEETDILEPKPENRTVGIYSNHLVISPDDIVVGESIYQICICSTQEPFSSFQMNLTMPYFVNVVDVCPSEYLNGLADTAIFDYEIDGNDVRVAYSSPVNFSTNDLFYINFTFNDSSEATAGIGCYNCLFVDENVEVLEAHVNLGDILVAKISIMGDVNGDSMVNLDDLLLIQRSIVSYKFALDSTQFMAADIDKNGVVDMRDCQYIQNYLVGRIDSLENVAVQECKHINRYAEMIKEATCTERGMECVFCEDCGKMIERIVVYPKGHNYEDGVCLNCYEKETENEVAILYTYASGELNFTFYSDYTCEYVRRVYNADGKIEEELSDVFKWQMNKDGIIVVYLPDAAYNFIVNEDGSLTPYTASECKHENTSTDTMDATCTNTGYEKVICNDCNKVILSDKIRPLGHLINEEGVCERCQKSEYGNEGGETDKPNTCLHESTYSDGIGETCTEDGHLREVCANCGMVVSEQNIPARGHTYTEEGVCVYCGEGGTSSDEGVAIIYTYKDEDKTLIFNSNYTAELTENVYAADGMMEAKKSIVKWSEYDGKIHVYTESVEYIFAVNEKGELVPVLN